MPDATAAIDEHYARLRRRGSIIIPADEAASLGTGLRRRAKADGLRVVSSRRGAKGLSPAQARQRPVTFDLTANGIDIVAPDADQS